MQEGSTGRTQIWESSEEAPGQAGEEGVVPE